MTEPPVWLSSDTFLHSYLLETQHKHLQKTQRTLTSGLRTNLTWWQRLRPEVAQPGHLTGVTFLQSERIHESSEVKTHVDNNSPTQTANVQSQQHEVREADSDQLPQKRQAEAGFYFLTPFIIKVLYCGTQRSTCTILPPHFRGKMLFTFYLMFIIRHLKVKLSPESNRGFICNWIWVKPSCKSIIME